MGNTLKSHENLVHLRGWTAPQIDSAREVLRRKTPIFALCREDFAKYFGGRSRESISIFNDLDTDRDGRVDVFEILITVILWSGTRWQEKHGLLFRLFDFMGKGSLRSEELLMFLSVVVRTMKKFVQLEPKYECIEAVRAAPNTALSGRDQEEVNLEQFRAWFGTCPELRELQSFVEDHAERTLPEAERSPMRKMMGILDVKVNELGRRVSMMLDRLREIENDRPDEPSRRKRFDVMVQNLRKLTVKLQRSCETQQTQLAELTASLNEDQLGSGMASLVEPRKRFRHEQMLMEVELLQGQNQSDFLEGTDLLNKLIELTYGHSAQVNAKEDGGSPLENLDGSMARGLGAVREEEEEDVPFQNVAAQRERAVQLEAKRTKMKRHLEALTEGQDKDAMQETLTPEQAAEEENAPVVVCITNFEPPRSHETQMLSLHAGDEVIAMGQDGRGWWYGMKRDGTQGWFPPAYVQMKSETPK